MQRQLVAAGDGVTLNHGDHRQRAKLDGAQHHLDAALLAGAGRLAALGHVEAGAEDVALAADHDDAVLGRDRGLQRGDHLVQQLAVERVALLGTVHPDRLDGAVLLDDDFAHRDLTPARCLQP